MTTNEPVLILGMMLVTFGVRYPVLAIFGRIKLPERGLRALRFVPPVVLTAIIVPAVVMPKSEVDLGLTNAYLIGGLVAAVVAWRSKNTFLTIVVGMAVFLIWRAVMGDV